MLGGLWCVLAYRCGDDLGGSKTGERGVSTRTGSCVLQDIMVCLHNDLPYLSQVQGL